MNGSQEVKELSLAQKAREVDNLALEKALKDTYNRAIKRSHELAAQKMKEITGLNIPGLI